MSTSDILIVFGPLIALVIGYAIMWGIWYYGIEKGYWNG